MRLHPPTVGAQSWCWGVFLLALTATVATKAVDNPGQLAQRLPRVPGLCPLELAAGKVWCEG